MIYVDATDLTHFLCARWFVKRLHSNVTAGFFVFFPRHLQQGKLPSVSLLSIPPALSTMFCCVCTWDFIPNHHACQIICAWQFIVNSIWLEEQSDENTDGGFSLFSVCTHTQLQTYICAIDLRDHSLSEEVVLLCHQLIRLMVNISSCCHHKQLSQPV